MKGIAVLLTGLALASCGVYREAVSTGPEPGASWRQVATNADRERLRGWRKAWDDALPLARAADPAALAAGPLLFDPDRALGGAMPPPGDYRCRTFKLGARGTGIRDFTAYPWFECRIAEADGLIAFEKRTGSQRPSGNLFADTDARAIFLGTLVLGDETAALRYGIDAQRDMAGYVERIADGRWRLVLPRPAFESRLDIIELAPAG